MLLATQSTAMPSMEPRPNSMMCSNELPFMNARLMRCLDTKKQNGWFETVMKSVRACVCMHVKINKNTCTNKPMNTCKHIHLFNRQCQHTCNTNATLHLNLYSKSVQQNYSETPPPSCKSSASWFWKDSEITSRPHNHTFNTPCWDKLLRETTALYQNYSQAINPLLLSYTKAAYKGWRVTNLAKKQNL